MQGLSFRKNCEASETLWGLCVFLHTLARPGDISESLYLNTHASIWQEAAPPHRSRSQLRWESRRQQLQADRASDSWHWLRQLRLRAWPDIINWQTIAATTIWAQLWHLVTSEGAGAMPNTGDGGGKGKLDAAKRLGMSKHQGNINYEHVHSNSPNSLFLWGIQQCHVKIGMFKNDCE